MSDFIYVFTNSAHPELVKIGKTDDVERRVKELSRQTGVPGKFEVFYSRKVSNAARVEKDILEALAVLRIYPNKEFLKIEPERLVKILQLVGLDDATTEFESKENNQINSPIQTSGSKNKSSRNKNKKTHKSIFSFSSVGIPAGSTLHFATDKSVTAEVFDDRKVKFNGKIMFLTQSARIVLRSKHGEGKYNNLSGPKYWKYKNELLVDRRHRLETQKSFLEEK